ncbi:MAG TPA: adenylate/guanylate cyclase domain-containing protein [Rhizomicrobium sp.]|nr:adenylate/guanylate cyclase domain-containing protein [Rhizomicrobium sp.]
MTASAWLSRLKQARAAVIVVVSCAVVAVFLVQFLAFLISANQFLLDWEVVNYTPAQVQDPDIVIVAVTEDTLAQFPYRAPIDRAFMADLLTALAKKQPRAIGVDYLFDQPTEPDKDAALKQVITGMKVPLRIAYVEPSKADDNIAEPGQVAYLKSYVPPDKRVMVNVPEDQFDVVRWIYPGQRTADGRYVMGFSRGLAETAGVKTPAEQVPIAWRGKPANGDPVFAKFPAHAVKLLPDAWFRNKVVLVGSDITLVDRHRTPFMISSQGRGGMLAGVEIQAYALSQLLHHRSSPITPWQIDLLIALAMAGIGAALGSVPRHAAQRFAASLFVVATFWLGAAIVFHAGGPLAGPVAPALALGMAFFAMEAISGGEARAQRKFIESVFSHHVAPEVVGQILNDPARMTTLEGERRVMTFLFTDVADFTTLSEKVEAKVLGHALNEYLEVMTELVQKHGGMVDKFIGDAVVAIFNAPIDLPGHAEAAVRCALEMDRFSRNFSIEQAAQGIPFGKTRIGVHTGAAMVGNFGSRTRHNYTAAGDAVNTAARLEGLNKYFGTNISVSGATRAECGTVSFRPTACVVLKGKTSAIEVWEPLQDGHLQNGLLARYGEAYAMLKMGAPDAGKLFESLAHDLPEDPCITFHLNRLRQGVVGDTVVMTEK